MPGAIFYRVYVKYDDRFYSPEYNKIFDGLYKFHQETMVASASLIGYPGKPDEVKIIAFGNEGWGVPSGSYVVK